MIFKWLIVLVCLALGYVCIRLLIKGNRALDQLQGTPLDEVDDLEQPRSKLLKTIAELRSENEELKKRLAELEKEKTN